VTAAWHALTTWLVACPHDAKRRVGMLAVHSGVVGTEERLLLHSATADGRVVERQ